MNYTTLKKQPLFLDPTEHYHHVYFFKKILWTKYKIIRASLIEGALLVSYAKE